MDNNMKDARLALAEVEEWLTRSIVGQVVTEPTQQQARTLIEQSIPFKVGDEISAAGGEHRVDAIDILWNEEEAAWTVNYTLTPLTPVVLVTARLADNVAVRFAPPFEHLPVSASSPWRS